MRRSTDRRSIRGNNFGGRIVANARAADQSTKEKYDDPPISGNDR